jgi:hypothetical protein
LNEYIIIHYFWEWIEKSIRFHKEFKEKVKVKKVLSNAVFYSLVYQGSTVIFVFHPVESRLNSMRLEKNFYKHYQNYMSARRYGPIRGVGTFAPSKYHYFSSGLNSLRGYRDPIPEELAILH